MRPTPHIVIAGAGAIGCFVGGLLAASGRRVTLLARPRVIDAIRTEGLRITDFDGLDVTVSADDLTLSDDPACLAAADIVLVTVKSGATAPIAAEIARHAPADAPVVSLQNGVENQTTLRAALAGRDVRAGMVPFNVAQLADNHLHRGSGGVLTLEAHPRIRHLPEAIRSPLMGLGLTDDMVLRASYSTTMSRPSSGA